MPTVDIDAPSFDATARAVAKFNRNASGYTPEEIVTKMEAVAHEIAAAKNPNGYIATRGYVVSVCWLGGDATTNVLVAKASIDAWALDDMLTAATIVA